ncbi:MAG: hypothetical protein AB3N13_15250 [Arenibacterium sp.]
MTRTVFLRTATALSLAIASLVQTPSASAEANRNCGPRDNVMTHLSNNYGETRRSIGLDARGGLLEIFASDASGSWTVTLTSPAGVTCLIASGQSFETLGAALAAKGDDA